MITKVVTVTIAAIFGYAFWQTRVYVVVADEAYDFSVGAILAAVIIVLAVIFRAGEAWRESGAAQLDFGDVHYESNSNNFLLEIRNRGDIDSGPIKIWLSRALNSDGSEASKTSMPILLGMLVHGVIANGHGTVKIGTVALVEKFFPRLSVRGSNSSDENASVDFQLIGFEWADTANRIYINLSISHLSRRLDAWYEMHSLSDAVPPIRFTAVKHPLTADDIRQQRAQCGVPPQSASSESTEHES